MATNCAQTSSSGISIDSAQNTEKAMASTGTDAAGKSRCGSCRTSVMSNVGEGLNVRLRHDVQRLAQDRLELGLHPRHHGRQARQVPKLDVFFPIRMLGHVLRLAPHHLAVRRVLSSASNWAVLVEDAGPALLGDHQCLLVRLLHLILRKTTPDEQVLQAGKLAGVVVHGSGALTRQLQQGVVMRDKERVGGDGEGKQPAGRIGTWHGEPGAVAVPLPR